MLFRGVVLAVLLLASLLAGASPVAAADAAGLTMAWKSTQPSYAEMIPTIALEFRQSEPYGDGTWAYGSVSLKVDGRYESATSVTLLAEHTVEVKFRAYFGTHEYSAEFADYSNQEVERTATVTATVVAEPVEMNVKSIALSADAKTLSIDIEVHNAAPTPWNHDLIGDLYASVDAIRQPVILNDSSARVWCRGSQSCTVQQQYSTDTISPGPHQLNIDFTSPFGIWRPSSTSVAFSLPQRGAQQQYWRGYQRGGYRIATDDGRVESFGGLFGSVTPSTPLNAPIVGGASKASENGYWLAAADGGVFTFGGARYAGSMGGLRLNKPIVGMAATPSGEGYWLVASDGGVFAFGDAQFYGSMGGKPLNAPIVGMSVTPSGRGYRFVASDGGVFNYGDAAFHGSMGGKALNKPIVGMTSSESGAGYWLVASDGGILGYGDAPFYGSLGSAPPPSPVVGIKRGQGYFGYWMVTADGGVYSYGNVDYTGSAQQPAAGRRVVSIF